jgi:hypothetical protein
VFSRAHAASRNIVAQLPMPSIGIRYLNKEPMAIHFPRKNVLPVSSFKTKMHLQLHPRHKKLLRKLIEVVTTTWVLGTIIFLAIFLYLYLSTSSRRLPTPYPMAPVKGDIEYKSKPGRAVELGIPLVKGKPKEFWG